MNCTLDGVTEFYEGSLCAIKIQNPGLFDVNKIFDCGQCFRFDRVNGSRHDVEYAGVAMGKYISVASEGDSIIIYNSTADEYEKIWKHYLAIDCDYEAINKNILSISDNANLADAVRLSSGIRILRQDGWEALCSFIISQNNNIPRIKKIIAALCNRCGRQLDVSGMECHMPELHRTSAGYTRAFPDPESIRELGVDGLFDLRTGFRAKYIYDAAERIVSGLTDLNKISALDSTDECSEELCRIKGVGPKVAACTLLFGFDKLDAFPVDVWIKKVIAKYFDGDFSPVCLGKFAGVAQQYLFYYERYLQS